ncbi:FG-GAP-like repeat-containing protein [Streptomyces sp. NBC_00289]|uniref:FG-GAP-like repeat-containing protein n=1 Tax=Streptomyces sp. NBC_00289 TaxID=2975703 RepID=UPI0032518933
MAVEGCWGSGAIFVIGYFFGVVVMGRGVGLRWVFGLGRCGWLALSTVCAMLFSLFSGVPVSASPAGVVAGERVGPGHRAGVLGSDVPPGLPGGHKDVPVPGGAVSGGSSKVAYLPGEGGVSASGDYTYHVPLEVPAGRAGMAPSLSLDYASSGGSGALGRGWSVSGLSQISRCAKSEAQDDVTAGVAFDVSDRYCLDGQKLVQVNAGSAAYGAEGAEYRTETDSFARIVSKVVDPDTTVLGPDAFVVSTKSGRVLRFEAKVDDSTAAVVQQVSSRVTDPAVSSAATVASGAGRRVTWLLRSESDVHGNKISYSWLQPVAGQGVFVPDRIDYTSNGGRAATRAVDFVYEDRGVEDEVSFARGVKSTWNKRLASVKMIAPNPVDPQMVWQYDLNYQISAGGRLELGSVKKSGYLGTATRAKVFSYGDDAGPVFTDKHVAVGDVLNMQRDEKPAVQVADLNGDGASDIVYQVGRSVQDTSSLPLEHHVRLGKRSESSAEPLAEHHGSGLVLGLPHVGQMRPVDADGDGKVELAGQYSLGGLPPQHLMRLYKWDDDQHTFVDGGGGAAGSKYGFEFADMDGDGRIDYLPAANVANGSGTSFGFTVRKNTGSGFAAAAAPQTSVFDYGCPVRATDVDGDGRAELVGNPRLPQVDAPLNPGPDDEIVGFPGKKRGAPRNAEEPDAPLTMEERCRNGTETYVLRLDAAGNAVTEPGFVDAGGKRGYKVAPHLMETHSTELGDFNGDGLADALMVPKAGGASNILWNTGRGLEFSGRTLQVPVGASGEEPDVRIADADGDGRDDVFALTAAGVQLKLSRGDGQFRPAADVPGNAGTMVPGRGRTTTQLGDFNADGRIDLVHFTAAGDVRLTMQDGSSKDAGRMMSVKDEGTAWPSTEVTYGLQWSERPDMVTQTVCAYPLVCRRSGMPVVREVASRAHLADTVDSAGQLRRTFHSYEDPIADVRGRGWLGFGTVRTWDPQRPMETTTEYAHRLKVDGRYYPQATAPKTVTTIVPVLSPSELAAKPANAIARVTRTVNDNLEVRQVHGGKVFQVLPASSTTKEWEQSVGLTFGALDGIKTSHLTGMQEPAEYPQLKRLRQVLITPGEQSGGYDAYGNLRKVSTLTEHGAAVTEETTFDNRIDATTWLPGLATKRKTTGFEPGRTAVTRTVDSHYNTKGQVDTVWVEKDSTDPDLRSTTTYSYDTEGLLRGTKVDDGDSTTAGMPTQESRIEYDKMFGELQPDEKIYPSQVWSKHDLDAYRPTVWTAVHPAYGVPLASMDANGVTTSSRYDDLGRLVRSDADGSASTTISYAARPDTQGGTNGTKITTSTVDFSGTTPKTAGTSTVATDALGRTLNTAVTGFDVNTDSKTSSRYDLLGRMVQATGAAPAGTTSTIFDSLDRPISTDLPGSTAGHPVQNTYSYPSFFESEVLQPAGSGGNRAKTRTLSDVDGRTTSVTETLKAGTAAAQDLTTTYTYAPFGLPRTVTDPKNNITTSQYDILGRRTQLEDPDTGITKTSYYGTGQIDSEIHDTSQHKTVFGYDDLGRTIASTTEDGTSTFVFDTAAHGIGKPATATSPDNITTTHRYDTAGRPAGQDITDSAAATNATLSSDIGYDSLGRPDTMAYPQTPGRERTTVKSVYNDNGYLQRITDITGGASTNLFTVNSRKPNLALEKATIGTSLILDNTYDSGTGQLHDSTVTKPGTTPSTVQKFSYGYLDNGQIETRTQNSNRTDTYTYDTLDRLTNWSLSGEGAGGGTTPRGAAYSYDTIGNLLSVTDKATNTSDQRTYDKKTCGTDTTAGPHTATSYTPASGPAQTLCYDSEGRQTAVTEATATTQTATYTAFDLPKTITKNGKTTTYRYDAYGQRITETQTSTDTVTFHFPGLYERRTTGATATTPKTVKHVFHLPGGAGITTQLVYNETTHTTETQHHLTDSQGSITATTDATGTIKTGDTFYYDPFGKRTKNDATPYTGTTGDTHHGYTGHQMDDDLGLINMKGRIYNPTLKRFLTPDPYTTGYHTSQALNRYTYTENNPTNLTDPTGYKSCTGGYTTADGDCGNRSGKGIPGTTHGIPTDDTTFSHSVTGENSGSNAQQLWNNANTATSDETGANLEIAADIPESATTGGPVTPLDTTDPYAGADSYPIGYHTLLDTLRGNTQAAVKLTGKVGFVRLSDGTQLLCGDNACVAAEVLLVKLEFTGLLPEGGGGLSLLDTSARAALWEASGAMSMNTAAKLGFSVMRASADLGMMTKELASTDSLITNATREIADLSQEIEVWQGITEEVSNGITYGDHLANLFWDYDRAISNLQVLRQVRKVQAASIATARGRMAELAAQLKEIKTP